jgi:hypothetical protein
MAKQPEQEVIPTPEHTHYKIRGSDSPGDVYPAMKSPPGYEDAHPEDWQPATAAEINQYKSGAQAIAAKQKHNPDGSTVVSGTGGTGLSSLKLAEDDDAPAGSGVPIEPAPTGAPIDVGALGFAAAPPPAPKKK